MFRLFFISLLILASTWNTVMADPVGEIVSEKTVFEIQASPLCSERFGDQEFIYDCYYITFYKETITQVEYLPPSHGAVFEESTPAHIKKIEFPNYIQKTQRTVLDLLEWRVDLETNSLSGSDKWYGDGLEYSAEDIIQEIKESYKKEILYY